MTTALGSPRVYTLLAVAQAGDAVACAVPMRFVTECLDDVGFPTRHRWIFPVVKLASAAGLAAVWRFPGVARFTAFMLAVYFVLAVGSHVRARDFGRNFAAATSLLTLFGAMAAQRPVSR
ncbi:MAG: DoxX family protein [Actinomycetota bacterium]|nr:DoxX family protein [Actinomycetota bacterium]